MKSVIVIIACGMVALLQHLCFPGSIASGVAQAKAQVKNIVFEPTVYYTIVDGPDGKPKKEFYEAIDADGNKYTPKDDSKWLYIMNHHHREVDGGW